MAKAADISPQHIVKIWRAFSEFFISFLKYKM